MTKVMVAIISSCMYIEVAENIVFILDLHELLFCINVYAYMKLLRNTLEFPNDNLSVIKYWLISIFNAVYMRS